MPAWNICVAIIRPRLIFGIAILLTRIIVYRIADFHNRELRIMKFKLGKIPDKLFDFVLLYQFDQYPSSGYSATLSFFIVRITIRIQSYSPTVFYGTKHFNTHRSIYVGNTDGFQFTCIDHLFQQSHRINIRTFIHEYFCNLTDTTKRKPAGISQIRQIVQYKFSDSTGKGKRTYRRSFSKRYCRQRSIIGMHTLHSWTL